MSRPPKPHELLEGLVLDGGWRVTQLLPREADATGGHFSCGYLATGPEGRQAYLKALDFFSGLTEEEDPARALEPLILAFNFERDLLTRCNDRRLSHVVRALFFGKTDLVVGGARWSVQYIAFELADGDIRAQMAKLDHLDLAWTVRSLHQVAVGLSQLHSISIAHQDTKPSNVLCFHRMSKLADLGRATARDRSAPHDEFEVAGDWSYAPPEALYGATSPSWEARRFGCDAYHLGSMTTFMFALQAMTPMLLTYLPEELHWRQWSGTYGDILPHLRAAFAESMEAFAADVPEDCRTEVVMMVRQLCDPDPALRGHPKERASSNPYSLRRYVTELDLLARRAEYRLLDRR